MKQLSIICLSFLLFLKITSAQDYKSYNNFYDFYKNEDGIVSFELPPGLFKFMLDKEEDKELQDMLKKMDNITFLIADPATPLMFEELSDNLPSHLYHDLMIIKDGSSTVTFKLKESGKNILEIIMVVEEPGSVVVMCVSGNFSEDDAKALAQSIKIDEAVNMQ